MRLNKVSSLIFSVLVFTTLAAASIPTAAAAGQIYVDITNTSGIEDGTLAHPYNTIGEGVNYAPAGYTVLVAPGNYAESIFLKYGITLQSTNGPEVTIISGNGSKVAAFGVRGFDNYTYVIQGTNVTIISGFTIAGRDFGIHYSTFNGTIVGNIIENNLVGVNCYWASPTIINNTITGNVFGISSGNNSFPKIDNNTITNNENGIYNNAASPTITNNIITNNADAGIHNNWYPTYPAITNNTIVGNGYGIRNYWTNPSMMVNAPRITNNIIAVNTCGIHNFLASPTIRYNDIWGNVTDIENVTSSSPTVANNISANPMFVNSAAGDYHLRPGSPCIDAGDNGAPSLPLNDADGEPRIVNGVVDMGAFEYRVIYNTPAGTDVTVELTENVEVNFENVVSSGDTTSTLVPGVPPTGFELIPENTLYEIATTAVYADGITISIHYGETGLAQERENEIRLMHLVDNAWTDITESIDLENNVIHGATASLSLFGVMVPIPPPQPPVEIEIHPATLNKNSRGKWMTCYIEFSGSYDVNDIDLDTILLENSVPAEQWPTCIGDHDFDGIPDLMVKFDLSAVQSIVDLGRVELTVTGEVGGVAFSGSCEILVIGTGKADWVPPSKKDNWVPPGQSVEIPPGKGEDWIPPGKR